MSKSAVDKTVVDIDEGPARSRTKTAERPRPGQKITIELDDADQLADFLLEVSKLIRQRRKLVITIE